MKLTKGAKPKKDIPDIFNGKSYSMSKEGDHIEIETFDLELIAWLQSKGFT